MQYFTFIILHFYNIHRVAIIPFRDKEVEVQKG